MVVQRKREKPSLVGRAWGGEGKGEGKEGVRSG